MAFSVAVCAQPEKITADKIMLKTINLNEFI
jgi:hypothetical protein